MAGSTSVAEGAKPRGRPLLVQSDQVLAVARAMLSERGAAAFSFRRLADALDVAPATLYARFGTQNELLARVYLQRMEELLAEFRRMGHEGPRPLVATLRTLSEPLSELRLDFALRFEIEGGPVQGVRSATWEDLRIVYLRLVQQVHALVREAAAKEGHTLTGGSLAERLLWSLLSSGTSDRNAQVFGHRNSSYFRFLTRTVVLALTQ